jgi:peptide deformylase
MILSIVSFPAKSLRHPAREVPAAAFGTRLLADQAEKMLAACEHYKGIGLAAQQVGYDLALAIVPLMIEGKRTLTCVANPQIVEAGPLIKGEEACLSFGSVQPLSQPLAPSWVLLRAQSMDGQLIGERVEGYAARAVFHECEHLAGRLLVDRVPSPWRKMFLKKVEEVVQVRQHGRAAPPSLR